MKWKEFNIAEFLIHQKKMGAPIANDLLFEKFSKILKQQQEQQQQQHQQAAFNNNNTPNPNINSNHQTNNNNNFYKKNHNLLPSSSLPAAINANNNIVAVAQAAAKAAATIVASAPHSHVHQSTGGVANNQLHEQMIARRSLSARLQQLQHPQLHQQQQQQQQQLHIRPNVGHMASAGHSGHHVIIVSRFD